jgi:hypothetical protein
MSDTDRELERIAFVRAFHAKGIAPDNPELPPEWASLVSSRFASIYEPQSRVNFTKPRPIQEACSREVDSEKV